MFETTVLTLFLLGLESNNLVKYHSPEIKISIVEVAIKAYITNFISNKTHVLRVFNM